MVPLRSALANDLSFFLDAAAFALRSASLASWDAFLLASLIAALSSFAWAFSSGVLGLGGCYEK